MYSLTTLRKRAYEAGYRIDKGFQHYMYNDAVCRDCNGDAYTGYNVWDLSNNQLVWEVVAMMVITITYVHWKMLKSF